MKAKFDDQRQKKKKKVNTPSNENNTNQKRAMSHKTKTKQRRKKPIRPRNGNGWIKKCKPVTKKECTLEAEVFVNLDHGSTLFEISQHISNGYRNE